MKITPLTLTIFLSWLKLARGRVTNPAILEDSEIPSLIAERELVSLQYEGRAKKRSPTIMTISCILSLSSYLFI